MINLYCYCIDGIVIHGPMPLPEDQLLGLGFHALAERSNDELKKYGWYPWIMPYYPIYDQTRFKLIPNRYCNGEYAAESFELVPLTDEEYIQTYVNYLQRLFLDTEPWLYNLKLLGE